MKAPKTRLSAVAAVAAAAGVALAAYAYFRNGATPREFQGWIEAYFIFVSPDEVGPRRDARRCAKAMRSTEGAPLFTLDADLQRAAVAENEAAVTNAKVTYDRAQELLKKAVGSQKVFDDAQAALRSAEARLNSARTRLDRRRVVSPVAGTSRRSTSASARWCRPAGRSCRCCRRSNVTRALLRAAGDAAAGAHRRPRSPSTATAAPRT